MKSKWNGNNVKGRGKRETKEQEKVFEMKEENIYLKQTKDHILTRGNGWKNKKIPDCTIAELLTKLRLTVLLQIVLVIYPKKKSYSPVTKITKEVRHREITESNKNFDWCKIIDASILQSCIMISLCVNVIIMS